MTIQFIESLDPGVGGPVRSAIGLALGFSKVNGKAVIVSRLPVNDELKNVLAERGVDVISGLKATSWPIQLRATCEALRATQVASHVHLHGLFTASSLAGGLLAALLRKTMTVQPHGSLGTHKQRVHPITLKKRLFLTIGPGRVLSRASAFVITDASEDDQLKRVGLHAKRVTIVYTAVPPVIEDAFGHASLSHRKYPDQFLLTVCRDAPAKRLDLIVELWEGLLHNFPDLHLLVAGDISERTQRELRSRLKNPRDNRQLDFVGMQLGTSKQLLLQKSLALVSLSDYENFSIVVMEALAAGTPVILRESVGAAKLLEHKRFSAILSDRDSADWTKSASLRLGEWLVDDNIVEEIRSFVGQFDWSTQASRVLSLGEI